MNREVGNPRKCRPGRACSGAIRPFAFLTLIVAACVVDAQERGDAVAFALPEEPAVRARTERAAEWLRRHLVRFERPGDARPLRVVAWHDPTLAPGDATRLAGYLITDTLWASKALQPFDPAAAGDLERTLQALGWTENGLQDVLFHHVAAMRHRSDDEDPVHGRSLGVFPIADGRTVDVRVMSQRRDPAYEAGHPVLFAEHAVYQALHDFWEGRRAEARRRILGVVRREGPDDAIFWDDEAGVLVDRAGREDWDGFQAGLRPTLRNASFKLGVLLYAVRLAGVEAEVGPSLAGIERRLWSAQSEDGGVAHSVEIRRGEAWTPRRSGSTGEAAAIAILAEMVVPSR